MKPVLVVLALCFFVGCVGADDDNPGDCASPQMFYPDGDGDGFGDMAKGESHCTAPVGFVAQAGDCKDDNAAVHPGAAEVCDAVDNNCDGKIDDADPAVDLSGAATFFRDSDGDGYGNAQLSTKACAAPSGFVAQGNDCNDASAAVNPGAREVCDGVDNNCNGMIDTADPAIDVSTERNFYRDADADGFGAGAAVKGCVAAAGYVMANGDCNDSDNVTYPGATEICDGADNDCDGGIDGTVAAPNRCAALVGTYTGSYSHLAQEKVGTTVVNSMSCSGTGSASLQLGRKPALQGSFTCTYTGSLGGFASNQHVTLSASVGLDGSVRGTIDHTYDSFGSLHRVYNVTGTQTATGLNLTGTGSFYPNPQSTVPWQVSFTIAASR